MPKIRTNGIEMYYEERGKGIPLILIMGLGADGSVWELHAQAYEKHFNCILVDNRGSGRSDKPEGPYSTKMMADDIAGLMLALGIDKAHIAGISMGSGIAQEFAMNYPDKVISLILSASWDRCDHYTTRIFETFRSLISTSDPIAFGRLLQLWIFTPQYHEEHLGDLLKREEDGKKNPYPMTVHAFQAQCNACIGHDTSGRFHQITAPVMVTSGDLDIFTPLHFSQRIAKELSNAELLVIPGTGHTHHWEELGLFNRKTTDFLLKHNN
jgi:pimeloyl-ACP methyl ester carboxylesterase